MAKWSDSATGCVAHYMPAGPKRDELLGLVRIGIKFKQQQHFPLRPEARTRGAALTWGAKSGTLAWCAARRGAHPSKDVRDGLRQGQDPATGR